MDSALHTDADKHVASVLSETFQGRSDVDWERIAVTAIEALIEYEDELNRRFIDDHPEILRHIPRVVVESDLRQEIATSIRKIHCHFDGTSAIAFGAARELAALTAEANED